MPAEVTTTVNATYEGHVERLDTSGSTINWLTTTRNATTGTTATTVGGIKTYGTPRSYYVLEKGTYLSYNSRTFFFFDLSGVGGTITAATLRVYNTGGAITDDIECVEAAAWGGDGTTSTMSTADYDEVALLGTGSSYSSLLTWAGGGAYNNFTLNATAISDMNTNGYLNCALLTQDIDYRGTAPSLGTDVNFQVRFKDSSNPIYLDITYTPAGWDLDVNGVVNSAIVSINNVTEADIINVIGAS